MLIREETSADLGIGQSWNRSPMPLLLHSNLGKSEVTWNLVTMQAEVKMVPESFSSVAVRMK